MEFYIELNFGLDLCQADKRQGEGDKALQLWDSMCKGMECQKYTKCRRNREKFTIARASCTFEKIQVAHLV